MASDDLVAICNHCGTWIVDVLDWVVIEAAELCAACYANPTCQPAKKAKEGSCRGGTERNQRHRSPSGQVDSTLLALCLSIPPRERQPCGPRAAIQSSHSA